MLYSIGFLKLVLLVHPSEEGIDINGQVDVDFAIVQTHPFSAIRLID